jgi:hypothetical protein
MHRVAPWELLFSRVTCVTSTRATLRLIKNAENHAPVDPERGLWRAVDGSRVRGYALLDFSYP